MVLLPSVYLLLPDVEVLWFPLIVRLAGKKSTAVRKLRGGSDSAR